MAMLKSFDLKGNKQSFANWISNLSPTETPFISMIPKEKVDQTQYQWQTDRLSQPGKQAHTDKQSSDDATNDDTALDQIQEGTVATINNMMVTKVHNNFTQIYRKAVRVTDTTKKISLYGRNSELAYQMEKAGLEIKRDLEHALLNSTLNAQAGTAAQPGICAGIQRLVAPAGAKDPDTGAIVHKVVTYAANQPVFTKKNVFDLTLDLYLVGSRANKIMFHPMHMAVFSDWIGNTVASAPHVHRMFDGLDDKLNAFVKRLRDPVGQEFTLIPNRHMPANQLFFFNEADWTQMVLREPEKILLAKMGSSEKHMIEMEVGLRHRNPFASGILEFNKTKSSLRNIFVEAPDNVETQGDTEVEATVKVVVVDKDGDIGKATDQVAFTVETFNDKTGETTAATLSSATGTAALDNTDGPTKGMAVAKTTVKHKRASRVKVTAKITDGEETTNGISATANFYDTRDVPNP